MILCFDVRYRGEIADMELIRKAYRVDDYIEAVEERDRAIGERDEDFIQNIPVAEPEMFPRLYRILDKVQERLGISFPCEVRLAKARRPQIRMVTKEIGPDDLLFQFAISLETIATNDDDELAFMFGYSLGWAIWGFDIRRSSGCDCRWRIRAECKGAVARRCDASCRGRQGAVAAATAVRHVHAWNTPVPRVRESPRRDDS